MSRQPSLKLEYETLVAEFQDAASRFPVDGNGKPKLNSKFVRQFWDEREALAKRHGVSCLDLADPPVLADRKPPPGSSDFLWAAINAVAYWFEKLEGSRVTESAINNYLAAQHGMGPHEAMEMTYSELAYLLRQDFERRKAIAAGNGLTPPQAKGDAIENAHNANSKAPTKPTSGGKRGKPLKYTDKRSQRVIELYTAGQKPQDIAGSLTEHIGWVRKVTKAHRQRQYK